MTAFEYRVISANGFENLWHDVVDGTSNGIGGIRVEFREKPLFEPGYFVDNSMTEEYRDEHGYGPRRVIWLDQDPHDTDWVRVNVTDRNF